MEEHLFKNHEGDCVDIMKNFPSGKVNLIVTDPPYNASNGGVNLPDNKTGGAYYKVNETALAIAFLKKMYEAGFRILSFGIESAKDKTLKEINKGFDISSVRKAFQIIAKYNFYIHSYFIVGNIGENEEDMLKISGFAKEIGIDTLGLSILRTEKYSPLNDVIKDTDGYYIGADNGVYSQKYGKKELKRIRKRIYKRFYTPLQCLKIARKTYSIGLFRLNSGIKGMLVYLFRSLMRRNS